MILSMVSNPSARAVSRHFKWLFDKGKKKRAKLWFGWEKFTVMACPAPSIKNQRGERIPVNSVGTTVSTPNGRTVAFRMSGYTIEGSNKVVFPAYTINNVRVGTAAIVISLMPIDIHVDDCRSVYVDVVTGKQTDLEVTPIAIDPADDNLLHKGNHSLTKSAPDGAVVWLFNTDGATSISKVVAGFGHVLISMYGPDIYDLDSATGALLHKYTIGYSVATLLVYPLGCIAIDHQSTTMWHLHDKEVRAIADPQRGITKAVTTRTGMVCFQLVRNPVEGQWYTLS